MAGSGWGLRETPVVRAAAEARAQPGAGVRVESECADPGELYRCLARSLHRIVRTGVRAPEAVIEEACQSAWARLVHHQHRVQRETALAWLVTTATREALRLLRRGNRELPLDLAEAAADGESVLIDPGPAELIEQRERLEMLALLPVRQQRALWLRGLGLSYEEIARRDGCTERTVERQLAHARLTLRSVSAA
jgi:RNA polymerase sigma factor (sigma-70 family)